MNSILSFPERGQGGSAEYRGNCAPGIIEELVNFFKPGHVLDPMAGSGTTKDVCDRLGIENTMLDLNPHWGAWDALNEEVPVRSDFIFWHPPYHDIIQYSGNMWGEPDDRDLSRCKDYPDFIRKINQAHSKLHSSLEKNGHIAVLVGDVKKAGILYSMMHDMAWIGQPVNVLIKTQHNTVSSRKNYTGRFIPIVHEYILIFKRPGGYSVQVSYTKETKLDIRDMESATWRDIVYTVLEDKKTASIKDIQYTIEGHKKTLNNPHWKEKIRQVLTINTCFQSVDRGVYKLAS